MQVRAKVMDSARQDIIAQGEVAQSLVIHQQVYQPASGGNCKYMCGKHSSSTLKCVVPGTNPTRSRCYCPAGSTEPKYISPGYYGSGGDNTNLTHSGQTICPKGYYCMGGVASCHGNVQCDGSKYYCPGGTYGSVSGLQTNACSGQCIAGWYCKPGSTISQQTECGYGLSIPVYCPTGSDSPKTDVGNGYTYCPITSPQGIHCSNMTREAKSDCKEGYACENGNIINVYWGGQVQSTSFGTPTQINDPRFAVGFGETAENTDDALVKDTKLTGSIKCNKSDIWHRFICLSIRESSCSICIIFNSFSRMRRNKSFDVKRTISI